MPRAPIGMSPRAFALARPADSSIKMADALTSVLAIAGLLLAWNYGWSWLDPAIGLVGALVIAHWSWRLIRDAGRVLGTARDLDVLAERLSDHVEELPAADGPAGDRILHHLNQQRFTARVTGIAYTTGPEWSALMRNLAIAASCARTPSRMLTRP